MSERFFFSGVKKTGNPLNNRIGDMTPNLAVVILKWREQYMKPCLAIASEKLFFVVDFLLI